MLFGSTLLNLRRVLVRAKALYKSLTVPTSAPARTIDKIIGHRDGVFPHIRSRFPPRRYMTIRIGRKLKNLVTKSSSFRANCVEVGFRVHGF